MRRSLILAALLLAVTAVSAAAAPPLELLDHSWSSASAPPGFNGEVRALLSYEGNLYVGGTFQGADAAAMNHVGRWDGTEWSGLGEGLNHVVFCLAGYGGDVVAGGFFSMSGADSISHLARWNGTGWQPFGSDFESPVTAAVEHEGELYVASYGRCVAREGRRGSSDCVEWDSQFLARWNESGQVWTPLATEEARGDLQFLGMARDLAVFDGHVVAAMPVRAPGNLHDMLYPAAILVDDRWEPFGPGVADIVGVKPPFAKCILEDEDQIFLAGLFPSVENEIGKPARLLKGDGTDWTALDPGFSGGIYALAGDGERLVVAGELWLQRQRGDLATGVSVWDGETWTGLTPDSAQSGLGPGRARRRPLRRRELRGTRWGAGLEPGPVRRRRVGARHGAGPCRHQRSRLCSGEQRGNRVGANRFGWGRAWDLGPAGRCLAWV